MKTKTDQTWEALCSGYLEWMRTQQFALTTVRRRKSQLSHLSHWCRVNALKYPKDVISEDLEAYKAVLFEIRKKNGKPLNIKTVMDYLITVQGFYKWLNRKRAVFQNPAADMILPSKPRSLPRTLSEAQIEQILNQADVNQAEGLRARTIMELLYSTGMRSAELANLKVTDVDPSRELVWIRQGKGRKDRVIPIGQRALCWLEKYLQEVRQCWVRQPDEGYVFVGVHSGKKLAHTALSKLVKRNMKEAQIDRHGACHLFRHSAATLMLEAGAKLPYIQEFLGHSSIRSTQIYTHVSIKKLREIHQKTHPAERK